MGSQAAPKPGPSSAPDEPTPRTIPHNRLLQLIKEIDPDLQLDDDVEALLNQIIDNFIDSTLEAACMYAKHRQAPTLDVKDVQLYLERHWNMWIPGYGSEEVRQYKRHPVADAHKQRMALIKKSTKKN